MNKHLAALLLAIPLLGFAAEEKPKGEVRDPRVIHASLEARRQWVIDQAEGRGAWLFSRDYEWILASNAIGPKEACQLAYLFFYSTGVMGGYFEQPVRDGDRFRLTFHSELGPVEGFPVFVDSRTGFAWQEGQKEKIDTLSLIRLFKQHRKEEKKQPNQSAQTTPGSCAPLRV
jgi:hypothetical protein